MKTKPFLLLIAIVIFSTALHAQKKLIDSTVQSQKTQAQLKVINDASTKISTGIDNVFNGNVFKRKPKSAKAAADSAQAQPVQLVQNVLEIKIDSVDYNSLSHYSEILRQDTHVKDVKPKFSNHVGFLTIAYTGGGADELLNDLLRTSDGKLIVDDMGDNNIVLTLKK